MAEPIHYPDITDATLVPLRVLRAILRSNPDALDSSDCPYTDDQKRLLVALTGGDGESDADRRTFLDSDEDRETILERQIALALEDIDKFSRGQARLEQKDRIAFLKAKPGLIEKLVSLNDKVRDQRAVGQFMQRMYQMIHDDLTVDQRTALIKKLGAFVGAEEN